MSEMVERIAIAVCEADGCLWSEATDLDKGLYRDTARAAIAAMREPTDAMIGQGYGYAISYEDEGVVESPSEVWRAMIDEALK